METRDLIRALSAIDIEDLDYVEKDLCFYELVSLGFLLYGEERTTAEFVLQKLLVLQQNTALECPSLPKNMPKDILRTYASSVNKTNWQANIVEALAIINARRVLRKLGFKWEIVYQHYLPHVAELSLHIHPMLKALYKICENMTIAQAGRLILYMDEQFRRSDEHLRFYDNTCLEVFILDWISRRLIRVGDRAGNGAELHVLIEYFKLNDLEEFKIILTETLKHNSDVSNGKHQVTDSDSGTAHKSKKIVESTSIESNLQNGLVASGSSNTLIDSNHPYEVRYETAGIVLIINQKNFYEEPDPELKHLLPPKLADRIGTDLDRDIIQKAFMAHGYKPVVEKNLSHIELLHCIRENAKRSMCYDSFVVCILSHGFNGYICGSNSIRVDIDEIEGIFAIDELREKPKMLIVQSCQTDLPNCKRSDRRKPDPTAFADVLKVMSTVAGFPSLRHTKEGSWFIQTLGQAIIKLGNRKHMTDIMTTVISKVSDFRGEKCDQVMLPIYTSTLRRDFFLPPQKDSI